MIGGSSIANLGGQGRRSSPLQPDKSRAIFFRAMKQ